ncbi:MAG: phospholipase D-like domain-containing protein [Myxococcaceae bacterium]
MSPSLPPDGMGTTRPEAVPSQGTVRLLDGGTEAFPRMLQAIAAARNAIHLETYTFAHDSVGIAFVEALREAARRGVDVRVIADGWGSVLSAPWLYEELTRSRIRVRIYHPISALFLGRFRRNHRKILLVDDTVAILGGINIGEAYATSPEHLGWADLAVEVSGPSAARLGARLRGEVDRPKDESPIRIWLSGLGGGGKLRHRYLLAITRAQRELSLAHAYFLPDVRLARALRKAAKRGVAVKLLLAGRSDVPFARVATLRLYRHFLQSGVRIFEWHKSVLHAKAAVVDQERILVGSFNLDPFSLSNLEALVEVVGSDLATQLHAWVERRIGEAKEIRLADCPQGAFQRFWLDGLGLFAARVSEWLGRVMAFRRPRRLVEAAENEPVPKLGKRLS